jgi:prephenate dehydrogenase
VLSHLPHVLAFGLAQTAGDLVPPEWRDAAAGSFRDGSRVAGSNPELWRTVFRLNRGNLVSALDTFDKWTGELRTAILEGDDEKLHRLLEHAHQAKKTLISLP